MAGRTQITHVLYKTPSTSRQGVEHTVAVVGELVCTCEHNRIRKADCRHVKAFLRYRTNDRARLLARLDRLEREALTIRQLLEL